MGAELGEFRTVLPRTIPALVVFVIVTLQPGSNPSSRMTNAE
jgi:hypothetical protein